MSVSGSGGDEGGAVEQVALLSQDSGSLLQVHANSERCRATVLFLLAASIVLSRLLASKLTFENVEIASMFFSEV